MLTVLLVFGTGPEGIKTASVVRALQKSTLFRPVVVLTGRHRSIPDEVKTVFEVVADHDLHTMSGLQALFDSETPDAVLVQGDTTSAMAAAIAAFERRIPVVHLGAGVRSGHLFDPFPEEANRRTMSQLASLHLAPTEYARRTLLASGVPEERIAVTGDTGIDALHLMLGREPDFGDPRVAEVAGGERPLVLVAADRRENHGAPMERIGSAVRVLAGRFPGHDFLLPAHPEPAVRAHLLAALGDASNILVTEPVGFADMVHLLERATLVLTDSGGVQEVAPALATPVLVLRESSERPEAVLAGASRLVGTKVETIVEEAAALLDDPARHAAMAEVPSPFGDGRAAERTVAALGALLAGGVRLPDFQAARPEAAEAVSVAAP